MAPYMNYFNFLQTIFILHVLVTVTCNVSLVSHDEECSALFQFKQSMIHQDNVACDVRRFRKLDTWKPTSNASSTSFNCCSWAGVVCNNDDDYSHVIGLDLSESFLCGHINSNTTIFNLVHLQRLNLAANNFNESQIPSGIVRLKQLRSLNLSNSRFSGQIPKEISQLVQLSSLDLSRNPLKLHLKYLVQNLTGLEELHLSGVDISSFVPHFLANFSSLRSIVLNNCFLQDEFPVAIFELPKLKILDVSNNAKLIGSFPNFRNTSLLEKINISYTGFFGIVPESLSNLNHLLVLHLYGCSFSERIPGSLSNMTQLTFLNLGSNKFTGTVPSLVSLSKLNVLQLNGNKFNEGRLPNWLGKLTELNELRTYNMSITGEIPHFLANLTKLKVLQLRMNSLIGHMPSSFFNLTKLRYIDLEQNQLQGLISSSFSNFKSLEYLGLRQNNFSGRLDINVFHGLNKLEIILLGRNKISIVSTNNRTNNPLPELKLLGLLSCNLKEFPSFLHLPNKIVGLFLSDNKIDGHVPMWILNNSQETLQVFDISNNSITGFDQPPHYLPWAHLETLDMSYNQMVGEIPSLICELKSLQALDLSSNNLSGTLPPCFGSLSNSLLFLDLQRNNFHGVMMNAFIDGSRLRYIDLSENGFVGPLPRSLRNCTNLEVLSLGDNSFEDAFPFWLGTLAKLQVLVLSSNKFYGPIQGLKAVYHQFSNVRIIDLSNNGFSGQLNEKYFEDWNAMKSVYGGSSFMELAIRFKLFSYTSSYTMTIIHKGVRTEYQRILNILMAIDLSCNHFEGEIPLSLQDLRGLQSLNLSNNRFTGRILPSLGYLKNLESLDLSRNKLSGEIPPQLVQLGFLAIFNVSFNHLNGRIPQGKQFNTFENSSYEGNPQLCGEPLSKECQDSKASAILPPASNTHESLLPSELVDWIIIFCGVGSGLVIGIVIGNFLHTTYGDRFGKRKDRWVRPLSNIRRRNRVN